MFAVMPIGVEHRDVLGHDLPPVHGMSAVMPRGVEHLDAQLLGFAAHGAMAAVMPIGVEHRWRVPWVLTIVSRRPP